MQNSPAPFWLTTESERHGHVLSCLMTQLKKEHYLHGNFTAEKS